MSRSAHDFLRELAGLSKELSEVFQETVDDWLPEMPPIIVAYAEIGRTIVDQYERMNIATRQSVFEMIERGMELEKDNEISIATATGLIEATAGRALRQRVWDKIRAELGPLSKEHADAWLDL